MLIAESYMANYGITKLEFFNQQEERNRILANLERLCEDDDALYIPRPVIPDKFISLAIPKNVLKSMLSNSILFI